ncbi:putative mucin TcMUCII [Trypanosoma cruzi]|uniref:Mucin TcMUCII, putative n=2 Tax=Trypanosoma cruzi TaxID=5693 RepID=Q4CQK9_TRYCC|nr:mucin TcMUCII, putative [Trypanosoma cruzi]EAN82561.1 mucin TcMUCII, putative [Trypanosoma cruzi]PWU93907.1 putative mucin TcMUCII [Trypanosoma cruzi]|eukprot:XP_804412.1 mucin TcMUCII [Trypanosoma cruzi strain CL Brener]
MMTMCRLLCALLVLALCCCPSVCAAAPELPEASSNITTTNKTQPPNEDAGLSRPLNTMPVVEEEAIDVKEPVPTGPEQKSADVTVILQEEGTDDTTESKSGQSISEEQADKNAEALSKTTTTTTTRAPTTATTTTTTAPVAQITTTTEAPTTTTTSAPSRLRVIDGSLGSSAWVCGPLLLAVSALAYTTVG